MHSGVLKATESDTTLPPGIPGLGVSGAHYLAKLGVAAVGADTYGLEVLPSENPQDAFPVHRILLAKYGVYILENMTTHKLVDAGIDEFMFTLGVPRLQGAVQVCKGETQTCGGHHRCGPWGAPRLGGHHVSAAHTKFIV